MSKFSNLEKIEEMITGDMETLSAYRCRYYAGPSFIETSYSIVVGADTKKVSPSGAVATLHVAIYQDKILWSIPMISPGEFFEVSYTSASKAPNIATDIYFMIEAILYGRRDFIKDIYDLAVQAHLG